MMAKNFEILELLDIYGELLTKRQRQISEDYYSYDLSLGEIADNYGITRQAACDALKSAEKSLLKYEGILNVRQFKMGLIKAAAADDAERLKIINELNHIL